MKKATKKAAAKKSPNAKPKSATAADILGFKPTQKKKPGQMALEKLNPKWRKNYKNLLELRQQLLDMRRGTARDVADETNAKSLHLTDSGSSSFDRDFALSLLSSEQDAIYEIDTALRRIENGTYNTCEMTGKAIPQSRLDAIPWTRFTVEAARELEQSGGYRRGHLGALGSWHATSPSESGEGEEEEESSSDNS